MVGPCWLARRPATDKRNNEGKERAKLTEKQALRECKGNKNVTRTRGQRHIGGEENGLDTTSGNSEEKEGAKFAGLGIVQKVCLKNVSEPRKLVCGEGKGRMARENSENRLRTRSS